MARTASVMSAAAAAQGRETHWLDRSGYSGRRETETLVAAPPHAARVSARRANRVALALGGVRPWRSPLLARGGRDLPRRDHGVSCKAMLRPRAPPADAETRDAREEIDERGASDTAADNGNGTRRDVCNLRKAA